MPYKTLILFVVLAGLAGCNAGTSSVPAVTEGDRSAGAIQHGRVTISVIGERRIRQVAVTHTDADGAFALDLPAGIDQPLLLEVKPAGDGRSRIICDLEAGCGDFARGEAMPFPSSFRMLSLVRPDEINGQAISINPYTHVASLSAVRLAGLINDEAITRTREDIGRGYGIDMGFWRHQADTVRSEDGLRGVVMTGLAVPGHRLVMRNGQLQVSDGSVAELDHCADCGVGALASADLADKVPASRLF